MYKNVKYSFFNFPGWYQRLYNQLKDGDQFVEIGTWTGASALFFGQLIKQGTKNIKFTTIDTFEGSEEHKDNPIVKEGKLLEYFLANRKPLEDYINVTIGDSKKVYKEFKDDSLAAIFFDGDHSHLGFEKDINLWYPKVQKGGIFSGYDYIWGGKGVKPVIDKFADKPVNYIKGQGVWWYEK